MTPDTKGQARIVFVIRDVTAVGGAQISGIRLAGYLGRAGHRVLVLGEGKEAAIRAHMTRYGAGGEVGLLPVPPCKGALRWWLRRSPNVYFWIPCLWKLWRYRNTYELIHAPLLLESAIPCALATALFGKPSVIKLGSGGHFGDVARLERNRLGFLIRRFLRLIPRFVCMTGAMETELIQKLKIPPAKICRIANGIDTERFRPPETWEKKRLRDRYGVARGDRLVLFVGRLEEKKRVSFLLDAWQRVCRRGEGGSSRLWIAGDGSLRAPLTARAQRLGIDGRTRFLGNHGEVHRLLRCADLFVMPSVSEGMSNACLEAMATGLPVVATDEKNNRSLLSHGVNGMLFSEGDVGELDACLCHLLGNPAAGRRLGRAARRRVVRRFSHQRTVAAYQRLYGQLVAAP